MTKRLSDGVKKYNNQLKGKRKTGGDRGETINLTDKKKIFKSFKGLFVWLIPLYFIIWLIKPTLPAMILILTIFILLRRSYSVVKLKQPFQFKRTGKSIIEASIFVSIIYGLFFLFEGYGLLAVIFIVFLIVAWRVWKQRVMFNEGLDQIMVMIKGQEYQDYLKKKKRGKNENGF